MTLKTTHIKSPGRVCLFGDHQDYLGLPVIACAINKCINLNAIENTTNFFYIQLPDINEKRIINIHEEFDVLDYRDYFASSLKVLRRYNCIPDKGYNIEINGTLPINAGLSSSTALTIAWIRFLIGAFGISQKVTSVLISRIAHEAEVVEHNEPGGIMDHYTIGVGGTLFINTNKPSYEKIQNNIRGLIIGESGIKKETIGTLGDLKDKAIKAIECVIQEKPNFKIELASLNDYEKLESSIPLELRPYFFAALKNHSITLSALKELKKEKSNLEYIGDLMNEHHSVLKNILKITVPVIDKMIDNALQAGAYGAKIVGSGGGGCIVAIATKKKQQNVIDAIKQSGKDAYIVNLDSGVRVI
ncbi:galactokinase [Flavobacteriaceae bacterium AU392]|nr:galactokinase [Flavobacteriaceae bacterium]RKM82625.1 galactokinase [Flavobacteriaceae bacterium AU392]